MSETTPPTSSRGRGRKQESATQDQPAAPDQADQSTAASEDDEARERRERDESGDVKSGGLSGPTRDAGGGAVAQQPGDVREGEPDEDSDLAPAPEQPADVAVFAGGRGTTILPVHVRDFDVEGIEEGHPLAPDPEADVEDTVIEGEQVEIITGAIASNGMALSINGNVFVFHPQMVGALKQAVDKAVVGLAL